MTDRVTRAVVLEAAPARVWASLVEADRLAAWLGGRVALDPRPGGLVSVADAGGERRGTVEHVEPGARLVLRLWRAVAPGRGLDGSRIDFRLEDLGGSCRLTVVESRLSTPSGPAPGIDGWPLAGTTVGLAGRG
ncbi:MAG: SRPBCC domain-containing protein [Acidimicrobiales bacterium]